MKRPFKIATSIIAILVAVLTGVIAYYWPIIEPGFDGSAHYTEQETRLYEHFTPDILKKMPRISDRYEFAFYNVSGPESQGYTVTFHDTTDTSKISAYLASLGYSKHNDCVVSGDCWRGKNPEVTVTVGTIAQNKNVLVSVVYTHQY